MLFAFPLSYSTTEFTYTPPLSQSLVAHGSYYLYSPILGVLFPLHFLQYSSFRLLFSLKISLPLDSFSIDYLSPPWRCFEGFHTIIAIL